MKIEVINVTPELAAKWLKKNTRNRKINAAAVNAMVKDMKSGRWLLNGETISFDENDRLVNGQHRLTAIALSGCTIPLAVATEVKATDSEIYDVGNTRNASDLLVFQGYDVISHKAITAVARHILLFNGNTKPTKLDIIEELKKNSDYYEWYAEATKVISCKGSSTGTRISAGIGSAILCAYKSGYSERKLLRFIKVFQTGLVEDGLDNTIIPLRNYYISRYTTRNKAAMHDIYLRTQRTLYNYENGYVSTICKACSKPKYKW